MLISLNYNQENGKEPCLFPSTVLDTANSSSGQNTGFHYVLNLHTCMLEGGEVCIQYT